MADPPSTSERTALYRLYNATSVLLYVGISTYPKTRFIEHAGDKNWWHHVTRKDIEWLDNREAALKAESEAIANERPLYNGYHHLGRGWPDKARKYDDAEDQRRVRSGIEAALERGEYAPDTPLYGSHVGREFNASPSTSRTVLAKLADEGRLAKWGHHFKVPPSEEISPPPEVHADPAVRTDPWFTRVLRVEYYPERLRSHRDRFQDRFGNGT
ncbi:hypothetical protein ACIBCC_19465 [Streptomyces griseus]|uniref:hypothetical protein n=1 Tax=Streptomyces griseus TaxID=1911 RepID=UPI0037BC8DE4